MTLVLRKEGQTGYKIFEVNIKPLRIATSSKNLVWIDKRLRTGALVRVEACALVMRKNQ